MIVYPESTITPLPSAALWRSPKVIALGFPDASIFKTSSLVPSNNCTWLFPAAKLYVTQFAGFFSNLAINTTVLLPAGICNVVGNDVIAVVP